MRTGTRRFQENENPRESRPTSRFYSENAPMRSEGFNRPDRRPRTSSNGEFSSQNRETNRGSYNSGFNSNFSQTQRRPYQNRAPRQNNEESLENVLVSEFVKRENHFNLVSVLKRVIEKLEYIIEQDATKAHETKKSHEHTTRKVGHETEKKISIEEDSEQPKKKVKKVKVEEVAHVEEEKGEAKKRGRKPKAA